MALLQHTVACFKELIPPLDSDEIWTDRRGVLLEMKSVPWPSPWECRTCYPDEHVIVYSVTPMPERTEVNYEGVWPKNQFVAHGTVAFFPAGLPFVGRSVGGSNCLLRCGIPTNYFEELIQLDGRWTARQLMATADITALSVQSTLRRIAEEIVNPGLASALLIEGLINTLLVDITRHLDGWAHTTPERVGKLAHWQMQRIEERLENLAGGLPNLEDLGDLCGIGSRQLMRAFQATTGTTVYEHIRALQLVRARRLLVRSDLPLKQIAYELGYAHAASFSAAFRRESGETPGNFRRRQRGV
ncbi:AraC family transcriptional regulator [Steroidobacter denitrificans]|uniref:AraC family transcriptional regulator n=1 Tax=Steroidobacter denitrificans TaxID=465721 RepID=A0A127F736_STEDE|nr:AraC family transcriptional regulator [Steroidobacter denitrificans]AMN46234.1 AraC family transcriptional regulator [Steroidobacter denitrificans]